MRISKDKLNETGVMEPSRDELEKIVDEQKKSKSVEIPNELEELAFVLAYELSCADKNKKPNPKAEFVSSILYEELRTKDLEQKISIAGKQKEITLKIDYPRNSSTCLYSCCIIDKTTKETYSSFYTKDKASFMSYITTYVMMFI